MNESPREPEATRHDNVSRRRFLARAGVTLSAAPLIALARADDTLGFPSPVETLAVPPPVVYDVTQYGAQGDGQTDDTNAVQAAIDAADQAGGGTIVFPAGNFLVSSALTLRSRIVLRGAGMRATILKKAPRTNPYPILKSPGYDPPAGDPPPIDSWSLQNLSLDGNRDAGALGHGLQTYSTGFSLFNVSIFSCAGRGLWSVYPLGETADGHPLEAQLLNVWIFDCTGGGIFWAGPQDSHWVNVIVYRCGPPGIERGSTTRGVEVVGRSHGLRVTNGHVWGLNHAIAWYFNCDGPGLMNCTGEGAEQTQLVLVGNGSVVVGGKFFAERADRQTVGIEIGDVNEPPTAGSFINTFVINCERGSLKLTNDAGLGRYTLSVWQMSGQAVVLRPGAQARTTNRLDLHVEGGADWGALGALKPVTFQEDVLATRGLEARGNARLGSSASKIGFFGTVPGERSDRWGVSGLGDRRSLDAGADLGSMREVLGTLVRELKRYGLLGS